MHALRLACRPQIWRPRPRFLSLEQSHGLIQPSPTAEDQRSVAAADLETIIVVYFQVYGLLLLV
jgi:hypothetical protein